MICSFFYFSDFFFHDNLTEKLIFTSKSKVIGILINFIQTWPEANNFNGNKM